MSRLGDLNTNRSWSELAASLKDELAKWDITRIVMPKVTDCRNSGSVMVEILGKDGQWWPFACSRFGAYSNGPERNLCAILMAVQGMRKMDQRGIAGLMVQASKLTALPDPNNPYHILGAEPDWNQERLRALYRDLVKKYHPDNRTTGDEAKWKRIQKAAEEIKIA